MKLHYLAALLFLTAPALAQDNMPVIPTEEEKILALKLAYQLNGNSMVRWGSIDLSQDLPPAAPKADRLKPDPKPVRKR